MSITINPGNSFLIFFGIIIAIVVVLMILKPGQGSRKILSLIILIAAFAAVYFLFGRPSDIIIDDSGVHLNAYGRINFSWSEVTEAEIIEDYMNTEWRPKVKISGSGMIGFKAGRYRLSGGNTAKILTQKSDKAVIFITDDEIYLLAVDETDKLIETASKYIAF